MFLCIETCDLNEVKSFSRVTPLVLPRLYLRMSTNTKNYSTVQRTSNLYEVKERVVERIHTHTNKQTKCKTIYVQKLTNILTTDMLR